MVEIVCAGAAIAIPMTTNNIGAKMRTRKLFMDPPKG